MREIEHLLSDAFAAAMAGLRPFAPRPALAVAVSGGADSLALAVLARNWAAERAGSTIAMVVDHGLRPASAGEARVTVGRLAQLGVSARLLTLSDLRHGTALAERARIMRYQVLTQACREAGIHYLLLGHHAADQIETLAMRVLRGSQTHGLAGMSGVVETADLHLLRPLLAIRPEWLRHLLTCCGVDWIEDPSNQDTRATRVRLRQRLAQDLPANAALLSAVALTADLRSREEAETAAELARHATVRPEGFAIVSSGKISPAALSRLIRTIGGGSYPPNPASVIKLAEQLRPATVAGVRITHGGRLGDGWLIIREEAAIMAPRAALADIIWDHRFKLPATVNFPAGAMVGKLGSDAAAFKKQSDLPSRVLRTLPAVRFGKDLAAVPFLHYAADNKFRSLVMLFAPRVPAAGLAFQPAG
jgi:tRNA(Ile)-lysidine synthase